MNERPPTRLIPFWQLTAILIVLGAFALLHECRLQDLERTTIRTESAYAQS